jgi:hypothetical protein
MSTDRAGEGGENHNLLRFFVFIVVFWPASLVLGVLDHWYFPEYDLRLINFGLGLLVGWLGVRYFDRKWAEDWGV